MTAINYAIMLIYQNTSKLRGKKNGTSLSFLDLSHEVNLLVRQPNQLLEDLRRLNQLKDSPYQNDFSPEKPKAKRLKF